MNNGRKRIFSEAEIIEKFIDVGKIHNTTQGKYALKDKNVLKKIALWRKDKLYEGQKITPIQFTFEITNKCNCNCKDCGMSANKIVGKNKLNFNELQKIIDSLDENGIASYAITGGEPFLEFDNMCKMIEYSYEKIDVIKIITNGFWGVRAEYYFKKLEQAGLFNNKFFIPSLQISIGEQNVPLESVCNIINYVTNNYSLDKLHLGIINTRKYGKKNSQLTNLFKKYLDLYGSFPDKKVYLTDSYYVNSNVLAEEKLKVKRFTVGEIIGTCDNRFKDEVGLYVSPKIFMKCNGDCYPCEVFNLHEHMYLGNLFSDGLQKVILNYNENKYINFIYKYGTGRFKDVIPKDKLDKKFETSCYACEYCIKFCEKNNLIK